MADNHYAASEKTRVPSEDTTPTHEKTEALGQGDQIDHAPSRHVHMKDDVNQMERKETTNSSGLSMTSSKKTKREEAEERAVAEGKYIIQEDDCYDELGFSYPVWKKWTILSVIFIVQVSMNFNTSLYSNAIPGISEEFGVSAQAARVGAAAFLILYAFGCELWAPWSEELGRWPTLQLSLFLVNIWQLPVALAPNFATIIVGRCLGGLSSAGGSVTLGMIADMWEADNQQYAVAFVVFSSVGGSVLGPVVGGFLEQYADWRWCIWTQLIFGGVVQAMHFWVPETRTSLIMDKIAKRRRENVDDPKHNPNIYGPDEKEIISFGERFSWSEIFVTIVRPFRMFLTEPIVLVLSLLSGFSDALIFMFIQSFSLVYGSGVPGTTYNGYGFSAYQVGLAFLPILVGYFIAWGLFIPAIARNQKVRRENDGKDERKEFESRLDLLLYLAPCLPIGLIGFAWTCTGPPLPWIASSIFAAIIGIANYAIYMATIDYMIAAYGPYSASATGGNGWSRDFLAGALTLPATPFFSNIGNNPLAYANTILFCISFLLVAAVYVIYYYGPVLRKNSPFAQQLQDKQHAHENHGEGSSGNDEEKAKGAGLSKFNTTAKMGSEARSQQEYSTRRTMGSRKGSYAFDPANPRSRNHTPANSRPVSLHNA